MMKHCLAVALLSLVLAGGRLPAQEPDFPKILRQIDAMGNFGGEDYSVLFTAVSQKSGEEDSVVQARMFRRDRQKQFCIVILKPDAQKGQGYLQAEDNLWFYDPESRKFGHSSLKENFQDSEARNSDFAASSLADDYRIEKTGRGKVGSIGAYVLELKAGNDQVAYPGVKIWIREDNHLLLKMENYGLSGRLMRTAYYPHYTRIGEHTVPDSMLYVDELRKGEKTQVTLAEMSTAPLPDSVFTKAFLERVSR
jgi:outer membrane lipoprotein-sorting protein